jgi:hypothetical protein
LPIFATVILLTQPLRNFSATAAFQETAALQCEVATFPRILSDKNCHELPRIRWGYPAKRIWKNSVSLITYGHSDSKHFEKTLPHNPT